jgi:dTDP-4-dehydrorhamnose reductase
MKILVTGGNGNLAGALVKKLEKNYNIQLLTHHDLDITLQEDVDNKVSTFKPHFVINTAAITDVDGCENQIKKALDVNSLGPYYLAKACRENDSILVHFSTEMIFDGLKTTPYVETDCPNPLLAYGLTKYIGEQNIKRAGCKYTILRTSWLFGGGVPKFVNNFIYKAKQAPSIKVVKNQTGSPTYIYDIAAAIDLYLQIPELGIYHLANSGEASRLDMAQFIKNELSLDCELIPVSYQDLNIKTYRPARAALDSLYRKKHTFLQLRPWQEALREYLGLTE